MNCPICGHLLSQKDRPASLEQQPEPVSFCKNCGWGKDRLGKHTTGQTAAVSGIAELSVFTWVKLAGLWALSAALVAGPYMLLVKAPFLFSGVGSAVFSPQAASVRMAEALTPHYWIGAAIYILACWTFNPPVFDRHNMGWFGGLVDNPFSFTDDINRTKFAIMLLMVPGKIIKITVIATFRLLGGS